MRVAARARRVGELERERLVVLAAVAAVDGARFVNAFAVGLAEFVDLHFEPKIDCHVGAVVIAFALGIREAEEDAGV